MATRTNRAGETASVVVRYIPSRVAFRSGRHEGSLESVERGTLAVSGKRATWAEAAKLALACADRRGITVTNRALVLAKIEAEQATKEDR